MQYNEEITVLSILVFDLLAATQDFEDKSYKRLEDFNNLAEIPVVMFTKDASKLGLNKMKKHIRHISVAEPHNKMSTTKQAIKKTNLPTSVSLSSSPYGHFSCHN